MNAPDHANNLALAVWRLAEAETLEKRAAVHRRAAVSILGAAHAEFSDALGIAKERREVMGMMELPTERQKVS